MKEASVFKVVIYLFKSYFDGSFDFGHAGSRLIEMLEDKGFDKESICLAFDWLDRFIDQKRHFPKTAEFSSVRIYSKEEIERIDEKSRSFIAHLEQHGILRPHTREMVINQAITLDEPIDIDLIKWVTILVLFTHPGEHQALSKLNLLVSEAEKTLH